MPEKIKINTAIAADARAALDELTDAPGDYLSDLIREDYRRQREAYDYVRARGWRRGEVLSVFDAANGLWPQFVGDPFGSRGGSALALELHDYARLSGLRPELGAEVTADAWGARVREVAEDGALATALLTLSRAWWHHCRLVEHLVDRLPRDAVAPENA